MATGQMLNHPILSAWTPGGARTPSMWVIRLVSGQWDREEGTDS